MLQEVWSNEGIIPPNAPVLGRVLIADVGILDEELQETVRGRTLNLLGLKSYIPKTCWLSIVCKGPERVAINGLLARDEVMYKKHSV